MAIPYNQIKSKGGAKLEEYVKQWQQDITKHPERIINEALQLLESCERVDQRATLHFWIALGNRYLTVMDKCLDHAYKSERHFRTLHDDEGLAKALNLIGVVYFYNGFYEKAVRYFYQAKTSADQVNAIQVACRANNNIGEVYRETGEFELSEKHYKEALELAIQSDELYFQAIIYENLGQLAFQSELLDVAFSYYQQSKELLLQLTDISALADIENKLGALYIRKRDFTQAENHLRMAYSYIQSGGNRLYKTEILLNLAELVQDFSFSYTELLIEAKELALSLDAHHLLRKIYEKLSSFHEKNEDFESALAYYKLFHQTEQAIESTSVRNKLELLRIEVKHSTDLSQMATLNEQLTYEIDHQRQVAEQLKQSNSQLKETTYKDELTKVYNRRGLIQYLATMRPGSYVFLLLDIDYFKHYNDSQGHVAGDHVLQQVASALETVVVQLTKDGIVTRMGGEEFLIVASCGDEQLPNKLIVSIQQEIKRLGITYEYNGKQQVLTISGGGIETTEQVKTHFETTYATIDRILYEAKQKGRNQIYFYSEELT